jgi:hypothetical protein
MKKGDGSEAEFSKSYAISGVILLRCLRRPLADKPPRESRFWFRICGCFATSSSPVSFDTEILSVDHRSHCRVLPGGLYKIVARLQIVMRGPLPLLPIHPARQCPVEATTAI